MATEIPGHKYLAVAIAFASLCGDASATLRGGGDGLSTPPARFEASTLSYQENQAQLAALKTFYSKLAGSSWASELGYVGDAYCTWVGKSLKRGYQNSVTCDQMGNVTHIEEAHHLGAPGESWWAGGEVDALLDALIPISTLRNLVLPASNLSGTVPWALVVDSFPDLSLLDLGANLISGTLPTDIALGAWSIDLSFNVLSGTIPVDAAGTCAMAAAATSIDLSSNCITGTIPSFAGAVALDTLNINAAVVGDRALINCPGSYQLSGTLPSSIGSAASIGFSGHAISGTFPEAVSPFFGVLMESIDLRSVFYLPLHFKRILLTI